VLVKHEGRGPHGAVVTGFKVSQALAVLVFPADDTLNAGIVDKLCDMVKNGYDIAAASRFIPGGEMTGCPWFKDITVRAASFTLSALARLPIHDATNGFRMFSRRVLTQIPIESTQGFTYSLELTVKCHRLGWPMGEMPARWRERERGTSRFRFIRWLAPYLRWYLYAFCTTWLFRRGVRGLNDASTQAVERQQTRLSGGRASLGS
jgi:dolichol-phosphate mannosyltransferase